MQHASICKRLTILLLLVGNTLFCQEKFQAMALFATVLPEHVAPKPPVRHFGRQSFWGGANDVNHFVDANQNSQVIIAKPKEYVCVAQIALENRDTITASLKAPTILFNYESMSAVHDALEFMSDEIFFDMKTNRYWQYQIFQIKNNKKGTVSIPLKPNYKHIDEKYMVIQIIS